MNKKDQFREAVIKFKNSDKTSKDYLDFIVISRRVLQPADGLLWEDIDQVLKEEIDGEPRKEFKHDNLSWEQAEKILLEIGIDKDYINNTLGSINGHRSSHDFISKWTTIPGYKKIEVSARKEQNSNWNYFRVIIIKE